MEHKHVTHYLTGLWTRLLGKEVTPVDDFFDLGGDSLTGINMIMEVQSTFHVDLDLETFFEGPCINQLAATIVSASAATGQAAR